MLPKGACVTDEPNLRVQHSPMLSSGYTREQRRKSYKGKENQSLLQELQSEFSSKLQKFDRTKIFRKHIRRVVVAVYKEYSSVSSGYDFPDIMVTDVNVLRLLLSDRIRGYED